MVGRGGGKSKESGQRTGLTTYILLIFKLRRIPHDARATIIILAGGLGGGGAG